MAQLDTVEAHADRKIAGPSCIPSGGAWDNAKKQIDDRPKDAEKNEGWESNRHHAAVIGDTVGDSFKETAGPA